MKDKNNKSTIILDDFNNSLDRLYDNVVENKTKKLTPKEYEILKNKSIDYFKRNKI